MSETILQSQSPPPLNELVKYLIVDEKVGLTPEKVQQVSRTLFRLSNEIRTNGKANASMADAVAVVGVLAQSTCGAIVTGATVFQVTELNPVVSAVFVQSIVAGCLAGSVYLLGQQPLDKLKLDLPLSTHVIPLVADKMRDTANWLQSTLPSKQE